jgi:hypothetical protein
VIKRVGQEGKEDEDVKGEDMNVETSSSAV